MNLQEDVLLSKYTTLGTGGPAQGLGTPETLEELVEMLAWARDEGLPVAAVGLGSNLLAADDGFPGLVLKLDGKLASARVDEGLLSAGGGAPLAVCLHRARAAELGGLEFVCAIPGTVGGGVKMNAGAYGGDIASVLVRALVADADAAEWRSPAELGLEYRRSALEPGQIVAAAEFHGVPRPEAEIKEIVAGMQKQRKDAQPTNKRTFGSVFKNPEHELSAGRMLEVCGLRGFRIGGAQISPKHANFIENAGEARSEDAVALIAEARRRAREQFGVVLEPEVQLLGAVEIPPLG
ncbi:MAG TPA: UDP-N-acetylmuramate dehydrogenase [Gaiellaceae bacterium]|nr:UDP-N-acetylmuramate dehydrogenase [Gaiellaceae bacterium]